jgi:hypothetical protein
MPKKIQMLGMKFNRLTVLSERGKDAHGYRYACLCDCQAEVEVSGAHLRSGTVKSCGCLRSEVTAKKNTKHGCVGSPEYESWQAMKNRCLQEGQSAYKRYGGRGIKICDRWMDFENFLSDMGARPSGMTLERINGDGNYEPSNCRWATIAEQNRNTSQVVMLTHDGKTMCMTDWAKETGIPYPTIQDRRRRGWSVELILAR